MKLQQSRAHMKGGRQPPGPHLAELVEYLQESWALAWVHLSFEASTKIKMSGVCGEPAPTAEHQGFHPGFCCSC